MRRFVVVLLLLASIPAGTVLNAWWESGHALTGQAAALALPPDMPPFFRESGERLAWLNYEPDRWKDKAERQSDSALYGGSSPEHYVNMERAPPGLFNLTNRFDFLAAVGRRGQTGTQVGLLPYRILEMFQSLRIGFRRWRTAPDVKTRLWVEQRIVDDAGIMGHFVADASNPLHATMHHNGWVGKNPQGFTRDDTLHARFEGEFVDARLAIGDVRPLVRAAPRVIVEPRREILQFLNGSLARVDDLYRLERQERFSASTSRASHKAFVAERLGAGATFLRDLWWTAWTTSAVDAGPSR